MSTTGVAAEVIDRYHEAWNCHDPVAVRRTFAPAGSYLSPITTGQLTGVAIERHARELLDAFPDLAFERCAGGSPGEHVLFEEWILHGTNTGRLNGNPPTGCSMTLPGVEVLTIAGGCIASARAYFDRRTFAEQLGLRVLVQPASLGPVGFGYCVRMSSTLDATPSLLVLTTIRSRSEHDMSRLVGLSQSLMAGLDGEPGFLSHLGAVVGRSMWTLTFWGDPGESARRSVVESRRRDAATYLTTGCAERAESSLWVPEHLESRPKAAPSTPLTHP